ncbi:MAG: polyprenyl synthetase family protein [Candidatus Asgardarchaeia archaeon]
MNIDKYLIEKGKIIEDYLKAVIPSDDSIPILYSGMRYALSSGGKRLRPILAMAVAEAVGGDYHDVLSYAAAIEIIHNFTLVHDDIEDGDKTRRNMPAVWVKYGLAHGINIGDALFAYAFKILADSDYTPRLKATLLKILSNTVFEISEGQALDMSFRNKSHITENDYFKMIIKKTGVLFSAALEGSALISGANSDILRMLREYGKNIGPAFQIRDDLLDLTEGKGRDAIGNDIREGKRSLMVVYCINKCDEHTKNELLSILDKGREKVTNDDVSRAIEIFRTSGALQYAEKCCNKLAQRAKLAIQQFPKSDAKSLLTELANYIITRTK